MAMYRCPDPQLEPPVRKNEDRINRLIYEIDEMKEQLNTITFERDEVVPYLKEQKYIVHDHIKAIENRYNNEIERIQGVVHEYESALQELMEG